MQKIINIGILAHVDAGKTTLTESLLYTGGAIAQSGSVDKGTTRTDTMLLERQRGITIQTAVASFTCGDCKINIVDTPGHMDFVAEVYRSLSVLDGAVLVISAKDGVQAQTRILFHALREMRIPTILFINKIDQAGIDLQSVYRGIHEKLSPDVLIMQEAALSPEITLTEAGDLQQWEALFVGETLRGAALRRAALKKIRAGALYPVYHGSAKLNIGTKELIQAIISTFSPQKERAELCGRVFKIEYSDAGQRLAYLRLYGGQLRLRDTLTLPGKRKLRITEMKTPANGELVPAACAEPGEIVILPDYVLKLNDVLGNGSLLPRKVWAEDPIPMLQTTIEPVSPTTRENLLAALTEIADTDPLLRYTVDDSNEIVISLLGKVQLEVVCALLRDKYRLRISAKEPMGIHLERPVNSADFTIDIGAMHNPFTAGIGLSVTPLPIGSGVQYESHVSLGYLSQSFQKAVAEGVRYGLEQGLYGWPVTDCKIAFEYGIYYSSGSAPADFRLLAPVVLEQALKKAGTQLLEPYLRFTLYAPKEYLTRAYSDAPKYGVSIETAELKNDEIVLTGVLPARSIGEYRSDLTLFTNGRSVCLTELRGYRPASGEPVCRPRRPNLRIDRMRHMLNKAL